MQSQNDLQAMQRYLRQQIIEKGYSPEDFMQYLMTQKTGGEDISNWNYQQLEVAVNQYKQKLQHNMDSKIDDQKLEKVEDNLLSTFEVIGEQQFTEIVIQKQQRVEYQKTNLFDSPLLKTVECVEYKGFLEDITKMNFDVLSYEIKNTKAIFFGLAKTSELWYTVRCSLINTTVNRSDSDFLWLRNTLIRIYPGHFIPPFNGVEDINYETDSSCKSRKQMANFFLKSLFEDQFIFNTKLVISFLTWSQYSRFNQFKNTYNSITFTRNLQSVQHPEGKVTIQVSNRNMNICKAAETLVNNLDINYSDLERAVRSVESQFRNASSSLFTLNSVFKEYYESYSRYCNTVPECKNNSIANCLITITNSVLEWAKTFKQYEESIIMSLQHMLKYNKLEIEASKQMLQRKNSWKSEYLKFKETLLKKKQRVIEDPSKWELPDVNKYKKLDKIQLLKCILPKQSNEQQKMKQWLAYINKRTELQIQRVIFMNTRRLAVYWTNYGIQNLQSTQTIYQVFKDISNGILLNTQKSSVLYQ